MTAKCKLTAHNSSSASDDFLLPILSNLGRIAEAEIDCLLIAVLALILSLLPYFIEIGGKFWFWWWFAFSNFKFDLFIFVVVFTSEVYKKWKREADQSIGRKQGLGFDGLKMMMSPKSFPMLQTTICIEIKMGSFCYFLVIICPIWRVHLILMNYRLW